MIPTTARALRAARAEELGGQGLEWLLGHARKSADGGGLAWAYVPSEEKPNPGLYYGGSGIVLALLEGWRHFGEDRYADAALRGARSIAEAVPSCENDGLYMGLTGMAYALRTVSRLLGDEAGGAAGAAADRALERVRARFDSETGRWNEMFELLMGNAGVGLGALASGDEELALLAVTPYLHTADPTPGGVNWKVRPSEARSHHMAHGTLGIVYALAAVGRATNREDLIEMALRGAADVVAREEEGPEGFLVPHSDPPHRPDIIERYSYGWCNGPAGDVRAFRLLEAVTGDADGNATWAALGERCWNTVTRSGLPKRIRPGFWDNNGSCCGTAGVLASACDRLVECSDTSDASGTSEFADLLVDDLIERATVDGSGARWSNDEHTATPSDLEPQTGWAHGNAGIVRELLRYARIASGGDPAYAAALPDHLPT